jgi:Cthe_2314-like HEPN
MSKWQTEYVGGAEQKPKRAQTRFLKRYIMSSDMHSLIGRVFDLSIVSMNFDSYDELAQYTDCKFAIDTNYWLTGLVRRVESLNMVGDMLWLDPVPRNFLDLALTRYQWLTVITDIFLTRYISVIDCALLLVNEVYRLGLEPKKCTLQNLKKRGLPSAVADHLQLMLDEQEVLRNERNSRVHHGEERYFTDDDETFKTASLFNDKFHGMKGTDRYGRRINVDRSFKEGLVSIQRDFNGSTRLLKNQLDNLYDLLREEFEDNFALCLPQRPTG